MTVSEKQLEANKTKRRCLAQVFATSSFGTFELMNWQDRSIHRVDHSLIDQGLTGVNVVIFHVIFSLS